MKHWITLLSAVVAATAARARMRSPTRWPSRLTGANNATPVTAEPMKLSRKSVPIVGTTEKYAP